jgi:diadenosine tetraphosphate (Ap4A) HIT family hydrolase
MDDVEGCYACDLSQGRVHLPGGQIHATTHWIVEHCTGPLGVGTLIVKPKRHVVHVADLWADEAAELGPLLQRTASILTELAHPEQVYVCLWSHGPVHIHFVVQPVDAKVMEEFGAHGPKLQVAMFEAGRQPSEHAVDVFADAARQRFAGA